MSAVLYVDDLTGQEKCDTTCAESLSSTRKEIQKVHAEKAELFLRRVAMNAKEIGMRVNPKKTQLLCTNTAINSDVRSYVFYDGERLESGDSL